MNATGKRATLSRSYTHHYTDRFIHTDRLTRMNYYTDGGSMIGSGIDQRDTRWSFTCQYCEHENEDLDAKADGYDVWAYCEKCVMPNEGRLDE
jgi:hypothetical protein